MKDFSSAQLCGFSIQGARHVQTQTPCQDAVLCKSHDGVYIMCAADGHGDKKHLHSDIGAQIAVEVAAQLLEEALRDLRQENRNIAEIEHSIKRHLPSRLVWEWNRRVRKSDDGAWDKEVVLYGCTILGAVMSAELCIFLQLGDGDILFINQEGSPEFIFPPDEDMFGTVTYSLCQKNSASYAKVSCRQLKAPKTVLMATDGLRDSLQDDAESFVKVGKWLSRRQEEEGQSKFEHTLPEWIEKLSLHGNGDDTTIALTIWPTYMSEAPKPSQSQPQTSSSSPQSNSLNSFFSSGTAQENTQEE